MKVKLLIVSFLQLFLWNYLIGNNPYIEDFATKDFLNSGLADVKIDYQNLDTKLLEATIFFLINKKRNRSRRASFKFNNQLENAAKSFCKTSRGTALKTNASRKRRFYKKVNEAVKKEKFFGAYLDFSFTFQPILNYQEGKKYRYFEDNENEEGHSFYYLKRNKNSDYPPILTQTYLELAEKIIRQASRNVSKDSLRSRAFTDFAVAVEVEQKTEKRLPYLKVFWINGGRRMAFISDE